MSYTVSTLLLRNLHDVFGEIDPVRRRAAIDEIFHEDAAFHEPDGVHRGRDEIDLTGHSVLILPRRVHIYGWQLNFTCVLLCHQTSCW